MATIYIALTALAAIIVLCTIAAFAWLFRVLKWEVVEDDEFDHRTSNRQFIGWAWARAWFKPRPRMLTSRRDDRGRFRRHRR